MACSRSRVRIPLAPPIERSEDTYPRTFLFYAIDIGWFSDSIGSATSAASAYWLRAKQSSGGGQARLFNACCWHDHLHVQAIGNAQESINNLFVPLGATSFPKNSASAFLGHTFAVWSVACHRVEAIRDREQARSKGNIVSGFAVGVSLPIPAFVMMAHNGDAPHEVGIALQQIRALGRNGSP